MALVPAIDRRGTAAEPAKPLFAGNDPIRLTISGPISTIASKAEQIGSAAPGDAGADRHRRNARDPAFGARNHPAQERGLPIPAAPRRIRGSSRPQRSLFHGQKQAEARHPLPGIGRIPAACAARICRLPLVQPVDPGRATACGWRRSIMSKPSGKLKASRLGFFIEDTDDLARRNGLREARMPDRISAIAAEPRATRRASPCSNI